MRLNAGVKALASGHETEMVRFYVLRHCQIAGNSCQACGTALTPKGQVNSTSEKFEGMVRIHKIGTIRSQVLTYIECVVPDAVQRLNGSGLLEMLG